MNTTAARIAACEARGIGWAAFRWPTQDAAYEKSDDMFNVLAGDRRNDDPAINALRPAWAKNTMRPGSVGLRGRNQAGLPAPHEEEDRRADQADHACANPQHMIIQVLVGLQLLDVLDDTTGAGPLSSGMYLICAVSSSACSSCDDLLRVLGTWCSRSGVLDVARTRAR